jgi:uncharacterized protein with PQ loop repeat
MPNHTLGLHHFHVRKRIHQKHEKFPHPNKLKRIVDRLIYGVTFFGIIMTLPQLQKIWLDHNAAGVSALSWLAYAVISVFWLTYGILHREKPIIFANSFYFILNLLVAVGALIYG